MKRTLKLPRRSGAALLYRDHLRFQCGAGFQREQISTGVADTVSQGAKGAGLRVIVGDGSHTSNALSHINAQAFSAVLLHGCDSQVPFLSVPQHRKHQSVLAPVHSCLQGGRVIHRLAICLDDDVSYLHACIPGIAAQVRVQLSNGQARCLQLQSHRPAHGNEYIRSPNRYAEQDP